MSYYPYAYLCQCTDFDDYPCEDIVFALSEEHACEVADDQSYDPESAKRAPQYDEHWPLGYVPPLQLLAEGWHWRCPECDREFSSDEFRQDDEHPEPPDPTPDRRRLYCSPKCAESASSKAELRRLRCAQIKAVITSQCPGAVITSLSPGRVQFRFPGAKRSAAWSVKAPNQYAIDAGDLIAWKNWRSEKRKEAQRARVH